MRWRWIVGSLATAGLVIGWLAIRGGGRSQGFDASESRAQELRDLAWRSAKVWQPTRVASADLSTNPPDPEGALSEPIVRCTYRPGPAHGTTPKFDCVLPSGEVVKVKYGRSGETESEIAATRLLTALGFGADRMYLIPRLRCDQCPRQPFFTMWMLDLVGARKAMTPHLIRDGYTDFEWVSVERKFDGTPIGPHDRKGWAWYELDRIDPAHGASRAEVDALRLVAILLSHWDNKAENQRFDCTSGTSSETSPCPRPVAIVQDLGSSWGPYRLNLPHWTATPIWSDVTRCMVSMRQLPFKGGTFPDVQISERGRQLIARQLSALTDHQVVALFSSARFREYFGERDPVGDPTAWARAFHDKVRQIANAGPCPS